MTVEVLSYEEVPFLDALKVFVKGVLDYLGLAQWHIAIAFIDSSYMTSLNRRYRDVHESTDVLSFSQGTEGESERMLGDIVLDRDVIRQNATRAGIEEEQELRRCVVHGILHLAGMSHPEGWNSEMIMIQEWIMARKTDNL